MRTYATTDITEDMITRARERRESVPPLPGSIYGPEARDRGAMGEIVAEDFMFSANIDYDHIGATTYDYFVNGLTVEIKSTSYFRRLKETERVSISEYVHEHQDADLFIFVALVHDEKVTGLKRFTKGCVVGSCTHPMIDEIGVYQKKGEPMSNNGDLAKRDSINLNINRLFLLSETTERLRNGKKSMG